MSVAAAPTGTTAEPEPAAVMAATPPPPPTLLLVSSALAGKAVGEGSAVLLGVAPGTIELALGAWGWPPNAVVGDDRNRDAAMDT